MSTQSTCFGSHRVLNAWCLATLFGCVVVGCGPKQPFEMVSVDGIVTYEGKPIDEAQVVFHPMDAVTAPDNRPLGITDEQGHFRLTTFDANDGAPTGTYKVTVSWQDRVLVGEEATRSGRSLIPVVYNDPTKTPLEHKVIKDQPQSLQLALVKQPAAAPKK